MFFIDSLKSLKSLSSKSNKDEKNDGKMSSVIFSFSQYNKTSSYGLVLVSRGTVGYCDTNMKQYVN